MKKAEKKKGGKDAKPQTIVDASKMPLSLAMSIDGQSLPAVWKVNKETGEAGFSTGSKGWGAIGKIVVAGHKCQVVCNIVIVGSKPEVKK
jgi:hypothetical protein